ncbi:hypothetical protein C8Q74DRAFT_1299524 [Fomes fomentarius]|nr:hypothetical protein C8Q74DRAFT_1299524 [Fomes fomentarius]
MSTATPGAVAATFPAELEECIIDELYYDIRALRNCTLTCRRWLPRTRYHLFAAIRVRTKDELLSLCALLSRSSHLLPLVRSLTIRAQRDHPEAAHLFQIVPFKLLASLPSLVCWKLSGLSHPNRRWTNAEKQVDYYTLPCHRMGLATIRRIATTVQELYLNRLSFISPVDCARLVSSLPALRELCCVDIGYRMRQDPEVVDTCIDRLPPCVHIETLSLIRVQTRAAYSLLRLLQSTVETLTIDVRMASYGSFYTAYP